MNKNHTAQSHLSALNRRKVKDSRELGAFMREMLDACASEAQAELNQANLELYDALVERCPKDTGRLAAGFQVSVGAAGAAGGAGGTGGDVAGGISAVAGQAPVSAGAGAAGQINAPAEAGGASGQIAGPGSYYAALESIRAANRAKIAACRPGESVSIFNNVEYLDEVERGGGAARGGFMALPLREHALKLQKLASKFGRLKI